MPVWRTIEPLGLLLGARRYLIGIDTARRDGRFRHYRVEDIRSAKVVDQSFAMPADSDLRDYATGTFGSFHNDPEFGEVVWRFSSEAADRARRYTFHPDQNVKGLADGGLEVRFHASVPLEIAWHLYSWGETVEVIEPAGLANLVHPFRRSDFAALS